MNPSTTTPPVEQAVEQELPMLAGIATFFHWWEELLNIVSGPVLLFGMAIALVDLLTDGKLTATSDGLLFAWAISQALGIDVQLMGSAARARHAHGWRRVGWVVLLVPLGYAAWQAGDVFAVQQSQHITEAAALAQLGISVTIWLGWRAALAVGLVILNGFTRYIAPSKVKPDYASERERLQAELELAPMRAALVARTALGWRNAATAIVTGEDDAMTDSPSNTSDTSSASDDAPEPTPTGPGSPAAVAARTANTVTGQRAPRRTRRAGNVTPLRRHATRASDADVERRVRDAWNAAPLRANKGRLSNTDLARRAGVGTSTASKWTNILRREDDAAASQHGPLAQ